MEDNNAHETKSMEEVNSSESDLPRKKSKYEKDQLKDECSVDVDTKQNCSTQTVNQPSDTCVIDATETSAQNTQIITTSQNVDTERNMG